MADLNPRIAAKLKQIPDAAVAGARLAMEEGAQAVVDRMKSMVPVDSGDLRDSIGWTWGDAPLGSFVIDEIRSDANRGEQYATLKVTIYAGNKEAFYARFIEFGTRAHSLARNASVERGLRQDEGAMHLGTTAQPFFFPSWKAEKAKFRALIRSRVRAAIKEAWRNG